MKKVDPKLILERYERSGLSQKMFAEREGMTAAMVSYYVRKAKKDEVLTDTNASFSEIVVKTHGDRQIIITTSQGVRIEIPA